MKQVSIELLGLTLSGVEVPETSAELNELAKQLTGEDRDVALEESTANLHYRGYFPKIHRALSDAIEAKGFERLKEVTQGKNGEVTKFLESPAKHLDRAKVDGFTSVSELTAIGNEWIKNNQWAQTVLAESSRQSKSLPKDIVAKATSMLAETADWDAVEEKFATVLPGFVLARDGENDAPSLDTLARALVAFRTAMLSSL